MQRININIQTAVIGHYTKARVTYYLLLQCRLLSYKGVLWLTEFSHGGVWSNGSNQRDVECKKQTIPLLLMMFICNFNWPSLLQYKPECTRVYYQYYNSDNGDPSIYSQLAAFGRQFKYLKTCMRHNGEWTHSVTWLSFSWKSGAW